MHCLSRERRKSGNSNNRRSPLLPLLLLLTVRGPFRNYREGACIANSGAAMSLSGSRAQQHVVSIALPSGLPKPCLLTRFTFTHALTRGVEPFGFIFQTLVFLAG